MKLGYCPIGNGNSIVPFNKNFSEFVNVLNEPDLKTLDAVIFWGGVDIHPSLYNQKAHHKNQNQSTQLSQRDAFEWALMKFCKHHKIPMIGVCRGAQLMCAFAGGSLIQHVNGHVGMGDHLMTTKEGEFITTTSCHHQMMYPFDVPHEMLAWSSNKQSRCYEVDNNAVVDMSTKEEPEVVYFPTVRGLAIQGHPEWAIGTRFAQYCNEMVDQYLLMKVEV